MPLLYLFPCLWGPGFYASGDILGFYMPHHIFIREQLAQGQFPLWDPFTFGGQPFAADPNHMAFYPIFLLSLPFPPVVGVFLSVYFHMACSGLGMARWLENSGVGRAAGWCGGLIYMASGFFFFQLVQPPVIGAYAFFPWIMASLEKLARDPGDQGSAFKSGVLFALAVLAGSPQMALAIFYGGLFYLIVRSLQNHGRAVWRKPSWARSIFFAIFGALPALALVIPLAEWAPLSSRSDSIRDYLEFNAGLSIHPSEWRKLLLPFYPEGLLWSMESQEPYLANLAFVGVAPFFLMAASLKIKEKRGLAWVLICLGAVGLLLALGRFTPFHEWVCQVAPGTRWIRGPFRFLFLWVAAASFLSGLGCAAWGRGGFSRAEYHVGDAGAALLALGWFSVATSVRPFRWWEAFAVCVGVLAYGARRRGHPAVATGLLAIALIAPLAVPFWGVYPVSLSSILRYEERVPWIADFRRSLGDGRAFIGEGVTYPDPKTGAAIRFPISAAGVVGIRNVSGYNPFSIARSLETRRVPFAAYHRLWAVQGFVTGHKHESVPGFSRYKIDGVYGYRCLEPRPIAYAPAKALWVATDDDAVRGMSAESFNPYLSSFLRGAPSPKTHAPSTLRARKDLFAANRQGWTLEKSADGWVVFSEVMFPGWTARLDGVKTPIITANSNFRAVWVPAGRHQVEFVFRPIWWPWIPIGLSAWIAAVAFGWFRRFSRRVPN